MASILLIEDDRALGYALYEYLQFQAFDVQWTTDFQSALQAFTKLPFDCCLIDVGLPDLDGFTLARELRRRQPRQPLLFLTARTMKADKLRGFALGADDYITKPVDEEELIARIRAVLRRSDSSPTPPEAPVYPIGSYRFVPSKQLLLHSREKRTLTERESHLLELLVESDGHILPREQVLRTIWGQNDYFTRRSMDVFVSRLRKYLRHDEGIRIRNVYGSGFVLEVVRG